MSKIEEYVENWHAVDGIKPCNESVFIDLFLEYLDGLDVTNLQFDGEGSYFGKQVTLHENYFGCSSLGFEVAYDTHLIKVYTNKHNGFWVPEYICMSAKHEDFERVYKPFMAYLRKSFGV